MSNLAEELRRHAWKAEPLPEEAAQRRQAKPGEEFTLTVHRNPGGHSRPHKRSKGRKVRVAGLSVNDWMGADWRVRQNLTEELLKVVRDDADAQNCPAFLEGRPYVQATYYFKDRRGRDWANYGKQVVDAVVKAGVLADDSDKAIDMDRNRIVEGDKNPRVEVYLRDTRLKGA